MVVKPNTAGARCRHRKVVQNPHSSQADTHDYFLTRGSHRKDMIISCEDLRLVGSARHCPTLAVCALRGGVPKVAPELLPWPVGVLVVAPMGWRSKKLSQNPRWGGVPEVGEVLSQNPRWGGVPKVRVLFQKWGGVSTVEVVFQKAAPESPTARWGGVPKLGWCSKKLSQNPHSVYYSGELK